jgi:type IV secretion system protein VirB5
MMAGFPKKALNSGTSAPQETPFLAAAQEWDRRVGDARVQARNWRYMAFGSAATNLIFAAGFAYEATRTHIAAYYVPIDSMGKPGVIQQADTTYNPTDAEISSFLAEWVGNMFSKPIDPIVMKQNMTKAFSELAGQGVTTVTAWAQSNSPTANMGHEAITVDVNSVLQRSPTTYQVDWTETEYEDGAMTSTEQYTGLFQITVHQPTDSATMLNNPLGLYISSISWSRQS